MQPDQIVTEIIEQYGPQLWLSFVTLVVTGFVLILIRNFIQDVVYYFKARMSDIGFGQRVLWKGEIYVVQKIHFKFITLRDDQKIVRIPISTYIEGIVEFPLHRYDDFDEKRYYQPPWDGHSERRRDNRIDDEEN